MNVEFVRFKASDNVALQGWLSSHEGEVAALHVHGMGGNGYQNFFLDNLREMYNNLGISFFTFDNRGYGIINDFRQADGWKKAGSCFEIFEESVHDIQGALDFLKNRGHTKLILQGHSLGCSKVVNYVLAKAPFNIEKIILLAPTDMVAWASADPGHQQNMVKAKSLLMEGKGEELVGAECWPLDKTPLSAQSYASKSDSDTPVDIYGVREDGAAPIARVDLPMRIIYGSEDIGITHPFGNIATYRERLETIKNPHTDLTVIEGASHSFRDYESELVRIITGFIKH